MILGIQNSVDGDLSHQRPRFSTGVFRSISRQLLSPRERRLGVVFPSSRIWESSSTSGWLYLHICIYIYMYILYKYIYIYIYTNMQHVMLYIYIYIYITRLLLTQGILVDVMTIYMTGKSWNCLKPARSSPTLF